MIDPSKIDFNQLPKKFCDGAIGAYGKEIFSFGLTSGNNVDSLEATPSEIDMTPPKIQSPIQMADLKKPDTDK